MRTVSLNLYKFDELPTESAKDKAREWHRAHIDFAWGDENLGSIKAFCDHFDAKLTEWSVGPYSHYSFHVDAPPSLFRGLKLKDVKRDAMPTGYCLDCTLWLTFYDTFKATGCATDAFNEALNAGFKSWQSDMESQLENDYIDDFLIDNEFEFDENGDIV